MNQFAENTQRIKINIDVNLSLFINCFVVPPIK